MTWRACSARLTSRQRVAARDPVLDDGVGDLAQGAAHGMDALDVAFGGFRMLGGLAARPVGAFDVDQAAIGEPRERGIERGQVLDRETILGLEGVQEVEGGVDADVVRVALAGFCSERGNHL